MATMKKSPDLIAVIATGDAVEAIGEMCAAIITFALPGVPVRIVTTRTVSFAEVLALPELRDASLFVTYIGSIYQGGTGNNRSDCELDFVRQLRGKTDAVIFVTSGRTLDADKLRQAGADFVEPAPFKSAVLAEIARAACKKWQAVPEPIDQPANRASSLDEAMEEYDKVHNIPIDVTDGVTHADFVAGVLNHTVGFKVLRGEPITLVKGIRKAVFNFVVMLYMVAPAVIVPIWAYHERNWWLLVGILVSWLAATTTARSRSVVIEGKTTGGFLLLVCLVLLVTKGVHNYFTFFSLAALWGCVLFQMAESAQNDYAMQSLVDSPELFAKAVAEKRILVVRKRDSAL